MDFFEALREVLAATWPEATANGFYRTMQIARVTLESKAEDLPFVIIDSELRNSTEWGLANRVDAGTVTIYYVCGDDLHIEDDLPPKLEALRDALWPHPSLLTVGQVIERPTISTSINLPLNSHFVRLSKPFQAGAVICSVIVGETPD